MKYSAFISYNSRDDKYAKWLQNALEHYKLPSIISDEKGNVLRSSDKEPKKFRVFRYVSDLVQQNLNDGLRHELDESNYLIVICSPNSAKSTWVGKEIRHFIETGRAKQIIPFIVDGTPYSRDANECFNPELIAAFPDGSLLGVNLNDTGDDPFYLKKRKAVAKTVSLLIDLPNAYDFIWNRYQREFRRTIAKRVALALLVVCLIVGSWLYFRPQNVSIRFDEKIANDCLPPLTDGIVTLNLGNEVKRDTLKSMNEGLTFRNIPAKYINKDARITFEGNAYMPLDTIVPLNKNLRLTVSRNPEVFGHLCGTLFNVSSERPIPNYRLTIGGFELVTDTYGHFDLNIPLEKQHNAYKIECQLPLIKDSLVAPCSKNSIIAVE